MEETGQLCKIRFRTEPPYFCTIFSGSVGLLRSFYAHTVTVLISQFFRGPTATYQYQREVYFMISLQHADQKNADGNSHLATTSHTLRAYLCVIPKQTWTRRENEKHNTGTTLRTAKDVLLRMCEQSGQATDNMQTTRPRSCYVLRLSVPIN